VMIRAQLSSIPRRFIKFARASLCATYFAKLCNRHILRRQAQLRNRARARLPFSVLGGKEASRASARAWAECWESARCASAMMPMVSGLASRSSGGQRPMAVSCRVSHNGRSCSPLGP
jgi:hypothetical protein